MEMYYVMRNGHQFGPYEPQQLLAYVNSGHVLLQDVAYSQLTGARTTVRAALRSEGLRAKLPSDGNIFHQLRRIGSDLIFPHGDIFTRQWFKDNQFLMLAIMGLVPLFLPVFSLGSEWLTFYLMSLYFSVLWGMIFYYFFRTQQVKLKAAVATFFFSQICVWVLYDFTGLASLNPFYRFTDAPFPLDMVGYVLGVGINEEVVKLLPLLYIAARAKEPLVPQTLVFYGLISGVAFGVYEGVEYQTGVNAELDYTSAHYLNVLRLTSLPFLHALWCGIGGYFLAFAKLYPRFRHALYTLMIAVPAVLHGLYDTFCNSEHLYLYIIALFVTVLSVILLMLYLRKGQNYQSKLRN